MPRQPRYTVQYDATESDLRARVIKFAECEMLHDAFAARSACPHNAHVLHTASGLQLHKVGNRLVWLDGNGQEQPAPR